MENMTSANPSSGVIILQGTQNNLEWLYTIEMTARSNIQDIWDFINPAEPSLELLPIPVLPNRPSQKDIIQTANFILDLSCVTRAEIEDIRRITGSVQNKVLGSISERLLPQLRGKSNVAEILSYLHKRYRPADQARRQEVISRWNKVKKIPNDITIMSWLDEWELVYADAKELKLPHIMDPQAQYDFLYSIERIAGTWTELKLAVIDDQASLGVNFTDFYDLLEAFRHKQRLNTAFNKNPTKSIGGSNSSGVFTVSGSKQDTTPKDRDQKGVKNCLCGMKHKFDDCFYLNFKNTTRPHTFKYKKEVFDKINGKLKAAYMGKVRAYITNMIQKRNLQLL
ncbi:hypothetical protein OnM2_055083 [Erysiphe neolycopersici]|uniref:Uncharacterized protein n=1 Tax=Erysiphe neolycopersici TaxID=212602 RepID=A0A420HR16_9PEZI|nr:hypothetical protein OnM2_055083 [Erysiphe neolycopersici]